MLCGGLKCGCARSGDLIELVIGLVVLWRGNRWVVHQKWVRREVG